MEDLTIRVVAEVDEAKRQLDTIQSLATKTASRPYKVQFKINYAELRAQMARIQQQKVSIQMDTNTAEKELRELIQLRDMLFNSSTGYGGEFDGDIDRLTERIRELKQQEKDLTLEQRMLNAGMSEASAEARAASIAEEAYRTALNRTKASIVQLGSRLQTLGRTLRSISGIFTRFFSGFIMGAGYKFLGKITEGFSGAFERADIMNTYNKVMGAAGYDVNKKFAIGADEAKTAVQNLEESVLGLPTGLDEIIAAQKVYVTAAGDMKKGTLAAIAANNTFVASATESRDQLRARKQIRNLLAGGEMTTARWQSILESMPLAVKAVGEELGYEGKKAQKKFIKALLGGDIDQNEFLDAFLKVGTEGKIRDMVEEMKHTYDAAFKNITNATRRMGANVLNTLSDTLKQATGKDLIDYINMIKGGIDELSKSLQDWIKANPDKITAFFERIRDLDILGIIKGVASAFAEIAEFFGKNIPKFGGEGFGKGIVYFSTIGSLLSSAGGLIKGTAGITSLLGVNLGGWTSNTGLFGFLRGLSKSKHVIEGAAGAAEAGATTATAVGGMALSWQKVASKAIAVASIPAIAGSMVLMAKAFKEIETLHISADKIKTFVLDSLQCLTVFGAYAEGVGLLLTTTPAGWLAAASEGVGIATILALAGTMVALAESLEKVQNVKLPSRAKIDATMESFKAILPAIQDVVNTLSGNKGIIAGWTKKSEANSAQSIVESFSGIIDTFVNMTKSLKKLAKVKKIEDKLQAATDLITKIGEGLEPLRTAINKAFGSYEQDFVEQGTQTVRKTFDSSAASEYEEMTRSLTGVLTNIVNMLTTLQSLQDKINEATRGGAGYIAFGTLKERLNTIIQNISSLVMDENGLYTLSQSAKWVSDISNLSDMMYNIGVVIDRLQEVSRKAAYAKVGSITLTNVEQAVTGISTLAKQMVNVDTFPTDAARTAGDIENVGNAIEKIGQLANKIRVAASLIGGGVEEELTKIREFLGSVQFNGMQNLYGSINFQFKVEFGDTVTEVYSAVWKEFEDLSALIDTMNLYKERTVTVKFIPKVQYIEVISMIRAAHYAINEALRWTLTPINRTVKINLNGDVTKNNMSSIYPHTGGLVGNGVLYRAGGGSIFRPRGTDTVPAMLTVGEWVMQKRAVDKFGTGFMERINNLDVAGAIRALHAKLGATLSSSQKTVITNNDNRSYNNVQHINTNNPNFAFRRSRWVSELR